MIRPVRSVTFPGVDAGSRSSRLPSFLLRHFEPGQSRRCARVARDGMRRSGLARLLGRPDDVERKDDRD